MQLHILSLSKNEISKLSSKQGFRFVNNAAAGEECTYFNDIPDHRPGDDDECDVTRHNGDE